MRELKIEIPYLPKSLNEIVRMKNILRHLYYKECEKDAYYLVKAEKGRPREPFKKANMTITFVFPDRKSRDIDNYVGGSKGFIDGIRKARAIEDDSWQKLEMRYTAILGEDPKTLIHLKEIE